MGSKRVRPNWETKYIGLPKWYSHKESSCQCRRCKKRLGFDHCIGKISWRRKWQTTPVFLSGKSHGQRSLVGYSPWGCKESQLSNWAHWFISCNKCITVVQAVNRGNQGAGGMSALAFPPNFVFTLKQLIKKHNKVFIFFLKNEFLVSVCWDQQIKCKHVWFIISIVLLMKYNIWFCSLPLSTCVDMTFFFFFKLFILYCSITDKQCCDSFRWITKRLSHINSYCYI